MAAVLLTERPRPLRFVLVGGLCALVQLALLALLVSLSSGALVANTAACLLSAQVNFALSDGFIWLDRRGTRGRASLGRSWLAFHASIAGAFLLNELVFIVARLALPDLVSAAAGIAIAAVANLIVQDALTFH